DVRGGVRRRHGGRAGVGPVRRLCQRSPVAAGASRSAPQGTGSAYGPERGLVASGASTFGGNRSAQFGWRRIGPTAGPVFDGEGLLFCARGGPQIGRAHV